MSKRQKPMLGPILITGHVYTLKLKTRHVCPAQFFLARWVEISKLDHKKQHVFGSVLIRKQIETLSPN